MFLSSPFSVLEKPTKSKKQSSKPVQKKAKTTTKKKEDAVVEDEMEFMDEEDDGAPKKGNSKKKTVEETYKKLDQIEHALARPDMYIGAAKMVTQKMWVYESDSMTYRTINFAPGLYKIFDEILVNASDNKQRDSNMKYLEVEIVPSEGKISVENDGQGMPSSGILIVESLVIEMG